MKKLSIAIVLCALWACSGDNNAGGSACRNSADCAIGQLCCVGTGNTCTTPANCPTSSCNRPVVPTAAAAQLIFHETHNVGETVSFAVPANTGSLSILQQAQTATLSVEANGSVFENSAVPIAIIGPGNQKLFDANADVPSSPDGGVDPSGMYALFGGGQASTAAFTIPNTAASLDAGIPTGQWQILVSDYAYQCSQGGCTDGGNTLGKYDITVLARPMPANGELAKLDVNFYLVANSSNSTQPLITAAQAQTDPSVQRMVSTFSSIYAAAGITVNPPVFHDVSDADRVRFGTNVNADLTGPCDELDQMFLLSSNSSGTGINLFLVQSIRQGSNTGSNTVVGIDGSIPGPSTLNGTVHSGAVVSAADLFAGPSAACTTATLNLGCGADRVAYIAAHETGHSLGLFHTTEMEGMDFDPLSDTAKCPCLSCASNTKSCGTRGAALVDAQACSASSACGGGDNLMFWLVQGGYSKATLTAQQGKVMRLNPAVHP